MELQDCPQYRCEKLYTLHTFYLHFFHILHLEFILGRTICIPSKGGELCTTGAINYDDGNANQ